MSERTYEMLWDCPYCGSEKLLGLTHRHCPSCGAAQDPERRYFPSDDERVAVEDHVFTGVDRICPNCRSPSSAAAQYCGSCGGPVGEGAQVKKVLHGDSVKTRVLEDDGEPERLHPEQEEERRRAQRAANKGARTGRFFLFGCLGLLFVFIAFAVVAALWSKPAMLQVDSRSWEQVVDIETYKELRKSDWCSDVPRDGRITNRSDKKKSDRKVPDGETCRDVKKDNGDGTFRVEKVCTTRYRSEPVYADWCDYRVKRWVKTRDVRESGAAWTANPPWPAPRVKDCMTLGCERVGERRGKYLVRFRSTDSGEAHDCDFAKARWDGFNEGSVWGGKVAKIGGALRCDTVTALEK